jgi:hypothetical protein
VAVPRRSKHPDPAPPVLASDVERDWTIECLGRACSEGRLTLGELEQRVEAALAARSRSELEVLIADLPVEPTAEREGDAGHSRGRSASAFSLALAGRLRHRGRWRLPPRLVHVALVGGASLDLRDAEVSGPLTTITVICGAGSIRVLLPEHVRVEVGGASGLGGRRIKVDTDPRPGAPLVRLRLWALSGRVRVTQRRS